MTRRLAPLIAVLLLVLGLASVPHGAVLAVPRCGTDHTVCTPTPSPTPQATPTPQPTTTPGGGMATVTTTFTFASNAQSFASIGALASGETNGWDSFAVDTVQASATAGATVANAAAPTSAQMRR